MRPEMTSVLVILLATTMSCDRDGTEAEQASPPVESESEQTEAPEEPGKAEGEPAESKSVAWAFEVDGVDLPRQEGTMVLSQTIGGATSYKMGSANAMNTITLKDVARHETGTFDPYSFTLMWPAEKWNCGYSSMTKDAGDLKIEIVEKGDGIRAEIEGDVRCSRIGKLEESEQATVRGWFED